MVGLSTQEPMSVGKCCEVVTLDAKIALNSTKCSVNRKLFLRRESKDNGSRSCDKGEVDMERHVLGVRMPKGTKLIGFAENVVVVVCNRKTSEDVKLCSGEIVHAIK